MCAFVCVCVLCVCVCVCVFLCKNNLLKVVNNRLLKMLQVCLLQVLVTQLVTCDRGSTRTASARRRGGERLESRFKTPS